MSKREDIEKKTEDLILPIISEKGLSLYDVDYVKEGSDYYLRVYIDKEGGVTIDDCQAVSEAFNPILDEKDYVDGAYIFEVSSPGLGRKLTKDRHFEKSIGEAVEGKLFKPQDGMKEFDGILTSFSQTKVVISDGESEIEIDRSNIASIRLQLDF